MQIDIRNVRPDDAPAIAVMLTDEAVMLGTMRLPMAPLELVEKRIAFENGAYKIVATVDGEVAGLGIMRSFPDTPRHNHVGEIDMICVAENHRGKGVGRALVQAFLDLADNWLQLSRLGLLVWSDNDRAIALYESLGFEAEGMMRRYARRPGGFADAVMMGRLRLLNQAA